MSMKSMYYILDKDKQVVPTDVRAWTKWFATIDNRRVEKTTLSNGYMVSTVFLGMDYGFIDDKPLVFETMVFPTEGDYSDLDMDRYSTWDEAVKGHERMVEKWRKHKKSN